MKTLLTLFVLFFSSSVFGEDDLNGTSIVCGRVIDDKKYEVVGFKFLNNNDFEYKFIIPDIDSKILSSKDFDRNLNYKTDLIKIYISEDNEPRMQISRKTIDVYDAVNKKDDELILLFRGSDCRIYTNIEIDFYLKEMESELIIEITKDNKL